MAITTRETTATGVTNKGSPLTNAEVDTNFVELKQGKLANTVEDTSPQLGGDLDLNSNDITGTGGVNITGNIALSGTVDGRDVATDGTKLDGIESGATADQTNAEIRAAVEAASDSNVFTDADHTKLNGIEASADVTDTANVTTAGALMDSEVTNLSEVKAFSASDYATAAQGTKADSALQSNAGSITSGFGAIDNGSSAITTTGTVTYGSLSDGTITVTAFVDEDNMASDSATLVPTQQSVKAYVDAQVTAQDLDFQGDSGGALSIDLDSETMTFTGGTGIDTSGSGNAVTFAIDSTVTTLTGSQTLTNKTLTSPDVNTPDIDGGTIDGTVIGGSTAAAGTFTTFTSTGIDDNATSTAITIDSSGRVSIGATSTTKNFLVENPSTASGEDVSFRIKTNGTGSSADAIFEMIASTTGECLINFGDSNDANIGNIRYDHNTNAMRFITNTSEAVRIDSSGNVLIGRTDATLGGGNGDELQIGSGSGGAGLTIHSSTSSNGDIQFADGTSGDSSYRGLIRYRHADDELELWTAGARRVTLDSSGNVGIGTDSPNTYSNYTTLTLNGPTSSALDFEGGGTLMAEVWSRDNDLLLQTTNADGELIFKSGAGSEAMRIRENGQLLVGGTANSPANVAMVVFGTGNASGTYDSGHTGIHINNNAASGGVGAYGAGLSFGRFGGSSDDNSAMIVPVQTASDQDHMGLSFWTHNTNTRGNPLGEVMRINSTGQLTVAGTTGGFDTTAAINGLQAHYETDTGEATLGSYSSGGSTFLTFHTNSSGGASSEAMRINAVGGVYFGTTGTTIGSGNLVVNEGVYVGAINGDNQIRSSSSGGGSATLYIGNAAIQVSSDRRLKENIIDTSMSALDKLDQVRVVDFTWNDPDDTAVNNRNARGTWTGIIAQELVDVFPFAVNAPRNEDDLSIDEESESTWHVEQDQLVPVLIKAIQELKAEVAALKGE